jgi:hypothetical protein
MRRMSRVADQANIIEEEKSYALERHSSRISSLLRPPFVKKKIKIQNRRNARRFQREEFELYFQPSHPITFEPFIEGFQGNFTASSVQ